MFFLQRIQPRYRGITAIHFLEPIRNKGLTDPRQIVSYVRYQAQQRAEHGDSVAEDLLNCLDGYLDEALCCAAYYVAYEQLTPRTKPKFKRKMKIEANDPPTPSQLAYLRALEYHEKPVSKLDANNKIVQLIIRMKGAPALLKTMQGKSGGVVQDVASWDFESGELVRFLDGGHWEFEGDSDTVSLVEQPEQRRSAINSDSVKGFLKKLLKWTWILMWYLIFFHIQA